MMMNKKTRNRERRTKALPADAFMPVKLQLPKYAYLQMKDYELSGRHTREEIFQIGLQALNTR